MTLLLTAASIGAIHTVLGPDHYLPFIAMARARSWSLQRTLTTTALCGLAHVLSSAALAAIGLAMGIAVFRLERIESLRGQIAGWLLLGFGAAYLVWGLRRAVRRRPHRHLHVHADGTVHAHAHTHDPAHAHPHGESISQWVLFTIFLFGPCEPLIPLLMYAAAHGGAPVAVAVAVAFAATTIGVMTGLVAAGLRGIASAQAASPGRLRRALAGYDHALAGFLILACGVAIQAGL